MVMNIVMMTNTYLPHVGGVAQSVHRFTTALRARGHQVLVAAPSFEGDEVEEKDVVRVPAVQNFNGSDFSVMLPIPMYLTTTLNEFMPDIFHSHHPFLMGDSALRKAAARQLPIVFTHHTLYEEYVHYVPVEAEGLKEFVKELSTGYANMCNHVVAPSQSIKEMLEGRGVVSPITVIPSGVELDRFQAGDRRAYRKQHGIPESAFLVGHLGRLAPEKNLRFLAEATARFMRRHEDAWMLVVGGGPSAEDMEAVYRDAGVGERAVFTGKQTGQQVVDAYHAMDVFAFSSKSETQGMVVAEAMAAGAPVVALDASGVREVVRDEINGRMLREEDSESFAAALDWVAGLPDDARKRLIEGALKTAGDFSTDNSAAKAEAMYTRTIQDFQGGADPDFNEWKGMLRRIDQEWDLWANRANAARAALAEE